MNIPAFHIEKIKANALVSWIIVALLLLSVLRYIKLVIAWLVEKLYEFLIQENAMDLSGT